MFRCAFARIVTSFKSTYNPISGSLPHSLVIAIERNGRRREYNDVCLFVRVCIARMLNEKAHGGRWSIRPARGRGWQIAMTATFTISLEAIAGHVGRKWDGSETE